ncbi:hypothetical protein JTB14_037005 [Gonioctena quinquepunctata]|nr:hypothetical protein JTB14_037005 [Gonioctena quinquepunctata]
MSNKLKKEYLTYIITTGKLPKSVNNQVVKQFLSNSRVCSENEWSIVADSCADVLTNNSNSSNEVIVLKTENHGLTRLLHHLEKRVSEQEYLIDLLTNKHENKQGSNQVPSANTTQTPSSNILLNYSKALTTSDQGPISGTSNLEPGKLPYTIFSKEGSRTSKVTAQSKYHLSQYSTRKK